MRAPWSSSYTTNINTEMNYWPTDAVGLGECFTPLVDFAEKLAANGSSTAKAYFDADGWCACHNSDIWGATYPAGFPDGDGDSSCYAVWFMSGAWILNQLYTHSLYQKDPAFDEKLKGMFAGALAFFHSSMTAHNGQPVTCPSISPENTFTDNGQRSAVTYMPSMDREILHDFMENCRALGLDAPVIDQVAPAPDGRVPEWAENYQETEVEHRHVSHLYCIYPSHRVQSDALQAAAKQSLLKRGFGGTGWSLGWKVCLWARLGDGENALRLIENQLRPINPKALIRSAGRRLLSQFAGCPPAVPDRRQLWCHRRHCRNAHWRCPAQMLERQGHRPGNPGRHRQLRLQKRQAGGVRKAIRLFHFFVGSNPPPLRGQQNTVMQLYQKRAPGGCSFVLYNYTYSFVPSVGSAGGV